MEDSIKVTFLLFLFLDHKNAVQTSKLRPQMVTAQKTSLYKGSKAVQSAMANVYFLAKSDCPSSMFERLNSFMLYQVHNSLWI